MRLQKEGGQKCPVINIVLEGKEVWREEGDQRNELAQSAREGGQEGWDGMQFPMGIAAVGNHAAPSTAATGSEGGIEGERERRRYLKVKAFTTPERPRPARRRT